MIDIKSFCSPSSLARDIIKLDKRWRINYPPVPVCEEGIEDVSLSTDSVIDSQANPHRCLPINQTNHPVRNLTQKKAQYHDIHISCTNVHC